MDFPTSLHHDVQSKREMKCYTNSIYVEFPAVDKSSECLQIFSKASQR